METLSIELGGRDATYALPYDGRPAQPEFAEDEDYTWSKGYRCNTWEFDFALTEETSSFTKCLDVGLAYGAYSDSDPFGLRAIDWDLWPAEFKYSLDLFNFVMIAVDIEVADIRAKVEQECVWMNPPEGFKFDKTLKDACGGWFNPYWKMYDLPYSKI